jgi:hypothetical protein
MALELFIPHLILQVPVSDTVMSISISDYDIVATVIWYTS